MSEKIKRKSERVREMKRNYMFHRFKEGRTNREIADLYSLARQTVYRVLPEIAEENGVSLDELRKPHNWQKAGKGQARESGYVDAEAIISEIEGLMSEIKQIMENIEKILEGER